MSFEEEKTGLAGFKKYTLINIINYTSALITFVKANNSGDMTFAQTTLFKRREIDINDVVRRFVFRQTSAQCYKTFYSRNLRVLVISYRVCIRQAFLVKPNVSLGLVGILKGASLR
jgi:hypothetical protein